MLDDDWTVVTADGKLSAQFEHTVLVTREGAEVLTVCTLGFFRRGRCFRRGRRHPGALAFGVLGCGAAHLEAVTDHAHLELHRTGAALRLQRCPFVLLDRDVQPFFVRFLRYDPL